MRNRFEPGWHDVVLQALHRYCQRHKTRLIDRQAFLREEKGQIVLDTGSSGRTPGQTVSRILQELRDEKLVAFLRSGRYLLADSPLNIGTEDLPQDAIDFAIEQGNLLFSNLVVANKAVLARQRLGQNRIRVKAIENYGGRCAFCDVIQDSLLVAAHISRWADDEKNRGNLHNVICICRFHDPLFEQGYFTLGENFEILAKPVSNTSGTLVSDILKHHTAFHGPLHFPPSQDMLRIHRQRSGFL